MLEQSQSIKSIDFFRMNMASPKGVFSTYYGAIVYQEDPADTDDSLHLAAILLPHPNLESLYLKLAEFHNNTKKPSIVLHNLTRTDLIFMLEGFCNHGTPIPCVLSQKETQLLGVTPFQKSAYQAVCKIPHGETRAYTWLASKLKKSGAERAVGKAMGSNPFPLLIPCHRVVKKDGSLGGFMGNDSIESWEVHLKRTLLDLEESHKQPSLFSLSHHQHSVNATL